MRYKTISNKSYWHGSTGTSNDPPSHPTHLYALRKYAKPGSSILDIGCLNGMTYEAIKQFGQQYDYKGVDILPELLELNKTRYPEVVWEHQDGSYLAEEDNSFDVAFSRGVIDYLPTFDIGLQEHCRVSRDLVIIWFWWGLTEGEKHQYSRIITGDVLHTEFSNKYSEKKVLEEVKSTEGWKMIHSPAKAIKDISGSVRLLVMKKLAFLGVYFEGQEWLLVGISL